MMGLPIPVQQEAQAHGFYPALMLWTRLILNKAEPHVGSVVEREWAVRAWVSANKARRSKARKRPVQLSMDDRIHAKARTALAAIHGRGMVVVPRESGGFITSQSPMTFHPMPPAPKEPTA
ncbi:hypothetical protein [Pseudoroseomonas ludipueritiae]|uniref:Uncharacterized protein n=1 Tax=Pseudoroseomonas ludipueritiae TaxID=198093 RepID=A0ABR7R4X0_9PROT|nr:hypothetical protein [Pseudoroseomonas ludipueritiae]MBC9176778.1 hypothetical protein [Pseudoroseomonas ludipueritiae]